MSHFINEETYIDALRRLVSSLKEIHLERKFDAIVAPKRSGLFPGVWASHALGLPMFTAAELRSMPSEFGNVLVVDTAVCKGKALQKIRSQLKPRHVFTAVIWREGPGTCDFVLQAGTTEKLLSFFYER